MRILVISHMQSVRKLAAVQHILNIFVNCIYDNKRNQVRDSQNTRQSS
jgi:hypothetical protein